MRSSSVLARFLLTLGTAGALAIPTGASHAQDRRTLSGTAVAIYDIVGHVELVAGTGREVTVEVTRGGRDAGRLTVEVGELRGRNTLRVLFPDDDIVYPALGRNSSSSFDLDRDGTWGERDGGRWSGSRSRRVRVRGSGRGTEAWADLRVTVPSGKQLSMHLGVGELTASNVDGELRLESGSGRITASRLKGNITIATGSGGIEARDISGDDLRLSTGSGGIVANGLTARRCKLETGSGGVTANGSKCDDLVMESGSGTIHGEDVTAEAVSIETGSGGVVMGLRNSPHRVKIETGSGGVTLGLPAKLDAQLDIETGSGGIDSDFPVQVNRMERNRLRGAVGTGSGSIRIETGSGGVRLRKN
jgi:lia operon protein LiaG